MPTINKRSHNPNVDPEFAQVVFIRSRRKNIIEKAHYKAGISNLNEAETESAEENANVKTMLQKKNNPIKNYFIAWDLQWVTLQC